MATESHAWPWKPLVAVLDACVLYPVTLRDTILRAAERDLFRPLLSAEILGELARSLVDDARATPANVERLIRAMHRTFPDAAVSSYKGLVEGMRNHPSDRHVLAAALVGGADVVVTNNVRHFQDDEIVPSRIAVRTPDDFLCHLLEDAPRTMRTIIHEQARALTRPPFTVADVVRALERQAPVFARRIRTQIGCAEEP